MVVAGVAVVAEVEVVVGLGCIEIGEVAVVDAMVFAELLAV